MTPEERDVLLPLLDRLRQTRVADKDAEADRLIRQTVQAQPDAPYILAQTVLMQDYALHAAQERIQALEQQLNQLQGRPQGQRSGGGFLGGLFGGGRSPASPAGYGQPGYGQPGYGPPGYGAQIAGAIPQPGFGGWWFRRGAAQTAAGVVGGALLFEGLEHLFGGHGGGPFGGAGLLGDAGGPDYGQQHGFAGNVGGYDQPAPDAGGGWSGGDVDGFVDRADAGLADADPAGFDDGGGASDFGDFGGDLGGDDTFGD